MTIHYRYQAVRRQDSPLQKVPSVPITLIGPSDSVNIIALLDSGADISTISRDIAESLGLNIKDSTSIAYGLGSKFRTVEKNLRIRFGKGDENHVIDLPMRIVVDVIDFPPLLGRYGFFDRFEITIIDALHGIWLKKFQSKIWKK